MSINRGCWLAVGLLWVGCGGGDAPAPSNVNPYARNSPQNSSGPGGTEPAPPRQAMPRQSTPGTSGPVADEPQPAPQVIEVPESGYAAEMGVPLTFLEYVTFARKSSEMLAEMTKIHAEVSESGDAEPYQDRWGELTASHTALARRVVETAYPPVEIARELNQNAIPRLQAELSHAQSVMEEFDDVEGGLAQPSAQAQKIFEHLTKNLSSAEVAESRATQE